MPGGPGRVPGAGGAGGGQPDAQRQQQGGDQQVEDAGAGDQVDPDDGAGDDAGQGPGDQEQGEPAAGLVLAPVPYSALCKKRLPGSAIGSSQDRRPRHI